jgi:hypothetical protein
MLRQKFVRSSLRVCASAVLCAIAIAAGVALVQHAQATDQTIDLDGNAANGQESKITTKVLQTYPVEIENTIFNNAPGSSYTFKWPGAGPGGFASYVTAGPGVGTKWTWSTVYQVYSIQSPVKFTPARSLSVLGSPIQGVQTVGPPNNGSFMVPGKSIYPTDVTLSSTSLTASFITFFSPEKTVATCGVQCAPGQCDVYLKNLMGGTATITSKQINCCPEANQTFCDGQCTSYLTDRNNCGACGNVCRSDEVCSDGACVCNPGFTECVDACVDLQTDPVNCGACEHACYTDEHCSGGACLCDPGLTQCGAGCVDLQTDPVNCGTCDHACYTDEHCSGGTCQCDPGLTQCGAGCVDLQNDPTNCGTCGTVCAVGASCVSGVCACPAGQVACGGTCVDPQNDPHNCGACGNVCGSNSICTGGACQTCRPPTGTACDNKCVNTHTDPYNCGACGLVCDFSNCPSTGSGTCSQGSSCVCDPAPALTAETLGKSSKRQLRFRPVHQRSRASTVLLDGTPPAASPDQADERSLRRSTAQGRVSRRSLAATSSAAATTTTRPRTLDVVEAPVCELAPIEQVIPPGGTYTQTETGGRFGKEIQTSVSIAVDGVTVAQGPCPLIVPVTDVDTSGVILSPISVALQDSSGDGLCQPGEARCDFFITVSDLGDTACQNPVATLTSPPDDLDPNPITFLNGTSIYPSLPAYPGDGVPLAKGTNATAFSITTLASQLPDVGRPFYMNVTCANQAAPVVMPITLGIGSACDPGALDGRTYDQLIGFQAPVKARLVPAGTPINFSTGNFNQGSTIPLKLSLGCGGLILSDTQINPKPRIVSLDNTVLGPMSLLGINGDNNANPDNPAFSCSSSACDFEFRTAQLPVGTYIIGVQMPDTRIFRAGLTVSP